MTEQGVSRTHNEDLLQLRKREKELREVLKLVFDLLEDYAPSWYTKEHHDRIQAALRS